jgi:hypothetical protein
LHVQRAGPVLWQPGVLYTGLQLHACNYGVRMAMVRAVQW